MKRKIEMIALDKLNPASWNPPVRTSAGSILELKKSIEEFGMLYPIMVDQDYGIIDGHRRYACAKALGWKKVPGLVTEGDRKQLFREVNQTTRRLSTRDELFVYISGGIVSEKALSSIKALKHLVDKETLEYAADNRLSASSIVSVLGMLCRYVNDNSDDFRKKAVHWIIYQKQQFAVRVAIAGDMDKKLVVAAIDGNAPIG
jgi:hypothetical protein